MDSICNGSGLLEGLSVVFSVDEEELRRRWGKRRICELEAVLAT